MNAAYHCVNKIQIVFYKQTMRTAVRKYIEHFIYFTAQYNTAINNLSICWILHIDIPLTALILKQENR